AVDSIMQKALAKKREERFPSAGALAQALQRAVTNPASLSETALRNAPTVISSHRPAASPQTPPPLPQSANAATETVLPARSRNEPSSGGFISPVHPTQPVTPYPAFGNRQQQPWLIFFGILLILILILGGVLVGLLLNRGITTTNSPSSTGTLTTINTPTT